MSGETAEMTARYSEITTKIEAAAAAASRAPTEVTLVAVSKTFAAEDIAPVLEAGHRVFGENRVQEAAAKWPGLKERFPGVEMHLIGPLQSNKAAEAVALFDVIETVDREKIAVALASEMKRQERSPKLFVQVNTGEEPQKAGIAPGDCVQFVERCRQVHGLAIEGLMCIPPVEDDPRTHFALLASLADQCSVPGLSMGMSADFEAAIAAGATHVRIGSALFGSR